MLISHELTVDDVDLCARECNQTWYSLNKVFRERSQRNEAVSHDESTLPHKDDCVHVFLDVEIHECLRISFLGILKCELFLYRLELLNEIQPRVSQKQSLDDQMMMRVVHLHLDDGALIAEEVDRLVFVSRLDLNARLPHYDVAGVHALAQLDNCTFLCCINGFSDGPVFSEFGVHNNFFRVFNFGRATIGQGVPGAIRSNPCYALNITT